MAKKKDCVKSSDRIRLAKLKKRVKKLQAKVMNDMRKSNVKCKAKKRRRRRRRIRR